MSGIDNPRWKKQPATQSISAKVEGWACYGLGVVPLTPAERAEVIEFALALKDYSRETLEALSDQSLVNAAHGSWSDYLRSHL